MLCDHHVAGGSSCLVVRIIHEVVREGEGTHDAVVQARQEALCLHVSAVIEVLSVSDHAAPIKDVAVLGQCEHARELRERSCAGMIRVNGKAHGSRLSDCQMHGGIPDHVVLEPRIVDRQPVECHVIH